MPYKPVGVDENSHFPPRVQQALADMFVTKPLDIADGQVPVWNAAKKEWIGGAGGSGGGGWNSPTGVDGGIWSPTDNAWVNRSGSTSAPDDIDGGSVAGSSTPDLDGGNAFSWK